MALIGSLGALVATVVFGLFAAALGHRLLRVCGLGFESDLEDVLCSAAVGVIAIEFALFWAQMAPSVGAGVITVFVIALVLGAFDLLAILHRVKNVAGRLVRSPGEDKILASLCGVLLALEGMAAMAPLTGSDAVVYHFAEPLRILRTGFHPNFSFINSFYLGQSHLLILAGLGAGSEKLAMGLIFLGGALSAASTACLARLWTSSRWALLAALSFVATPVVFWQISASGCPDIWMSFFVTMAIVVLVRMNRRVSLNHAALAGILAGAIAGAKYTGCFVAFGIALAFIWETRSFRGVAMFLGCALCAGIWPYARNWVWTGDPMFPYLLHWIMPSRVNSYALASQKALVGRAEPPGLLNLARFSLFAGVDRSNPGFWELLGPLPLAFAPAILLAVRNTRSWRTSLIIWLTSSILIGASTSINRYLLAVFPLVLAAVFAGIAELDVRGWQIASGITRMLAYLSVLVGTGGLLLYSHPALSAATGITSREIYLSRRAPDYEKTEFLNKSLGKRQSPGKVLIFYQHVYYLKVPFVRGDPDESWIINPADFQSEAEWQTLFREQQIRWVLRAPDFPEAIAEPLNRLEADGVLVPFERGEANDFSGMRIAGERETSQMVLLRVAQ